MVASVVQEPELSAGAREFARVEDGLEAIAASPDAPRWHALFNAGDTGRYPSTSEADFDLAVILARQFGDEPETIANIMRDSVLAKEPGRAAKWQSKRGAQTYLDVTISTAVKRAQKLGARDPAVPSSARAGVEPVRARTLSAIWADPDAFRPREVVIPRLAWRGRMTMYAAPDKGGKSTLLASGVAALTGGQAFLGELVTPGIAVWCLLEEHVSDFAARARTFGTPGDRLAVFELRPGLADLRREVSERRADVVVIDTLIRWAGDRVTEAGQAAQWAPILDELRAVARELNVAVVVLHHARKSDGRTRDSGEITANADVVIEQAERHVDGIQRLMVRGRWVQPDFAVRLIEGKGYELVGADAAVGPRISAERRRVLDALKSGMRWAEWLAAYGSDKKSTFSGALKWLRKHGLVTFDDEAGTYARDEFAVLQTATGG